MQKSIALHWLFFRIWFSNVRSLASYAAWLHSTKIEIMKLLHSSKVLRLRVFPNFGERKTGGRNTRDAWDLEDTWRVESPENFKALCANSVHLFTMYNSHILCCFWLFIRNLVKNTQLLELLIKLHFNVILNPSTRDALAGWFPYGHLDQPNPLSLETARWWHRRPYENSSGMLRDDGGVRGYSIIC